MGHLGHLSSKGTVGIEGKENACPLPSFLMPTTKPVLQSPSSVVGHVSHSKDAKGKTKKKIHQQSLSDKKKSKPAIASSVEDQATMLLMKGCGLLEDSSIPGETMKAKFHKQFVDPMGPVVEDNLRVTFGIQKDGGADSFSALAINVDD